MDTRLENLYAPITSDLIFGLEDIDPRDLHPNNGTILVISAPEVEETKGGVVIPDKARKSPPIARVIAVPNDPECPVSVGDWVWFRPGQIVFVPFGGRRDIGYLQYSEDMTSEILGWFNEETMERVLEARRLQPVSI